MIRYIDRAVIYYLDWVRAQVEVPEAFQERGVEPLDPVFYFPAYEEFPGPWDIFLYANKIFSFLSDPIYINPRKIRSMSVGDLIALKFRNGETDALLCGLTGWKSLEGSGWFDRLANGGEFNSADYVCTL